MAVPAELTDFVGLPDSSFRWRATRENHALTTLRLTTQSWRGIEWVHSLTICHSLSGFMNPVPAAADTAVIYITGGPPNSADLADLATVASISGLNTAMLFDMPNQPIFGREEDELIAYTFDQFLGGGDPSWPLLFPMAKSVIRAMDALEEWSGGRLKRFVLMGESKRAWTAWMAAATGDPRIIGITPTVFDNLNVPDQLAHQLELWDRFSPAIHDYTDLALPNRLDSDVGRRLARIVDPLNYMPSVGARVLLVHGANDPYWAPDALSLYIDALPEGTTLLTLPNEGHVFADKGAYYATACAFARACALNSSWPGITSELDERNIYIVKLIKSAFCSAVCTDCRLFIAESESGDFSETEWRLESRCTLPEAPEVRFGLPRFEAAFQAVFVQADFEMEIGGLRSTITISVPTVLRRTE